VIVPWFELMTEQSTRQYSFLYGTQKLKITQKTLNKVNTKCALSLHKNLVECEYYSKQNIFL
jgi:hypothetical protein